MDEQGDPINIIGLFEAKKSDYPVPKLVPVTSRNIAVDRWFQLRLGKCVLAHFTCWWDGDKNDPQKWNIILPGPDGYKATEQDFTDPVSAAHWFYLNHIKESL